MRKFLAAIVLTAMLTAVGYGQGQTNQSLSSYNVNGPASAAVGMSSPIPATVGTDCPIVMKHPGLAECERLPGRHAL